VAAAVPLRVALVAGGLFGVVGALAGECLQRVLYAHAETHLDPPAASIVVTSFLIGVMALAGVLPSAVWVPTP
jgi:formate hydrogenlyase subunit 3/multisubunit Na+/H+ antiporter MnhD subunit